MSEEAAVNVEWGSNMAPRDRVAGRIAAALRGVELMTSAEVRRVPGLLGEVTLKVTLADGVEAFVRVTEENPDPTG